MTSNEQDALTERIIACAITVHKELGPGLLEAAYRGALAIELEECGFNVVRERLYPAIYKGIKVGDLSTRPHRRRRSRDRDQECRTI
jgi:GxxExxY protein